MADVSDGLLADLGHIISASDCAGAIVHQADLPLSDAAKNVVQSNPDYWPRIWGGGDDYELVFTSAPQFAGKIKALARELNVGITKIGQVTDEKGIALLDKFGHSINPVDKGFEHK